MTWCTNASSTGANVILNTPTNSSVSFSTGENTFNGWREEGPDFTGKKTSPVGIFD